MQGIFKTEDVIKNDPGSVACPANTINVMSVFPWRSKLAQP